MNSVVSLRDGIIHRLHCDIRNSVRAWHHAFDISVLCNQYKMGIYDIARKINEHPDNVYQIARNRYMALKFLSRLIGKSIEEINAWDIDKAKFTVSNALATESLIKNLTARLNGIRKDPEWEQAIINIASYAYKVWKSNNKEYKNNLGFIYTANFLKFFTFFMMDRSNYRDIPESELFNKIAGELRISSLSIDDKQLNTLFRSLDPWIDPFCNFSDLAKVKIANKPGTKFSKAKVNRTFLVLHPETRGWHKAVKVSKTHCVLINEDSRMYGGRSFSKDNDPKIAIDENYPVFPYTEKTHSY